MHLVEVLRPFMTYGRSYERGEVVDATDWPKLNAMVRARYVRAYVPSEPVSAARAAEKGKRHGVSSHV